MGTASTAQPSHITRSMHVFKDWRCCTTRSLTLSSHLSLHRQSSQSVRLQSRRVNMSATETATANGTHVAGLAWQMQKLGSPGKSAAGAFTSPFSLYIALAMALRGAGALIFLIMSQGHVVSTARMQGGFVSAIMCPCTQLPRHLHTR